MRLHVKQLPLPEAEFRNKLNEYLAARNNHKETVGIPAPFPPFEIMRAIAESNSNLVIYDGDEPQENLSEPLVRIMDIERNNPITHRALREFFIGFGAVNPQFKETVLYQKAKAADDAIRLERAKL